MSAPHLPPKSCNIKTHSRLLALPVIIFLTVLSLLSGITAALVTVTWIIPPTAPDQVYFSSAGSRSNGSPALDPTVLNQTRQRMVDLYDSSKNANHDVYNESAFVGHAMMLSSDGWAVAAVPYRSGKEKNWFALDYQGIARHIDQVVNDSATGLVYLKLRGDGFRIAPFGSFGTLAIGSSFWSVDNGQALLRETAVVPVSLTSPIRHTDTAVFSIMQPEYAFSFAPAIGVGSTVLTDHGELIGFADQNNRLIPGWFIEAALSSLLQSGKISYLGLPIDGSIVSGFAVAGSVRSSTGFYVSRVRNTTSTTQLKKGDIILRINGAVLDPVFLARDIFDAPASLTLTIWRDGVERDVAVKKVAL